LYSREATAQEVELGLIFLGESGEPGAAWADYAQVLLSSSELYYVN
jgi:hypothetical protein